MANVQRYKLTGDFSLCEYADGPEHNPLEPSSSGPWVSYTDYAILAAERNTLLSVMRWLADHDAAYIYSPDCQEASVYWAGSNRWSIDVDTTTVPAADPPQGLLDVVAKAQQQTAMEDLDTDAGADDKHKLDAFELPDFRASKAEHVTIMSAVQEVSRRLEILEARPERYQAETQASQIATLQAEVGELRRLVAYCQGDALVG